MAVFLYICDSCRRK